MGTRASIIIKHGEQKQTLHRNANGYPSDTGPELGKILDDWAGNDLSSEAYVQLLISTFCYALTEKLESWAHYVYIVNLSERSIVAFATSDIIDYFKCSYSNWTYTPFETMPREKVLWSYQSHVKGNIPEKEITEKDAVRFLRMRTGCGFHDGKSKLDKLCQHLERKSHTLVHRTINEGKKTEIYVVTSGCYSEYSIEAVFTDKKLAEQYADEDSERSIEVYVANECEFKEKEEFYHVCIYTDQSLEPQIDRPWYKGIETIKYCKEVKEGLLSCSEHYELVVKTIGVKRAKAIALERYHAFLAVKETHFPFIFTPCIRRSNMFRLDTPRYGYFDYKIYIDRMIDHDFLLDTLAPKAPIPFEGVVDPWNNDYSKEEILAMLNGHGVKIDCLQ